MELEPGGLLPVVVLVWVWVERVGERDMELQAEESLSDLVLVWVERVGERKMELQAEELSLVLVLAKRVARLQMALQPGD